MENVVFNNINLLEFEAVELSIVAKTYGCLIGLGFNTSVNRTGDMDENFIEKFFVFKNEHVSVVVRCAYDAQNQSATAGIESVCFLGTVRDFDYYSVAIFRKIADVFKGYRDTRISEVIRCLPESYRIDIKEAVLEEV